MSKGGYEVWCQACGCLMKLRKGKYGDFYGCTGYPLCRNTLNVRDAALNTIDEEDPDIDKYERWDR